MSENVSSNVLFHFTKSMDAIKSILTDGFFPHYCPEYSLDHEDLVAASSRRPPLAAVPMVCFCDLPLSLISKHLREYGNFGIGLDKKWGIQNGVAPVIYTHSKAKTRPPVSRLTSRARRDTSDMALRDLRFLAAYTKPYEGPAWRNDHIQKRVRFYDQREWRYVPVVRGSQPLFLDFKDYADILKRDALHNVFKKDYSLSVTPDVIQYLIVPSDKDEQNILDLHDYIMELFEPRFSRKDAVLVGTAIMTDDCIKEDI
jgi:Putative abortive phage resistance protein AbiGi, antitoxin